MNRTKAFIVCYDGSYLGGAAVVIATSEEQAMELVKMHPKTENFEGARVTSIIAISTPSVLYNDNGDY